MPSTERSARMLTGLLASAAVAHYAAPSQFDAVIPPRLPGRPRTWTHASGAVELALAVGIAVPRTRRVSAYAAAAFFVAVVPANAQMAYNWRRRPLPWRVAAVARVPLQIPLVLWARNVARSATG